MLFVGFCCDEEIKNKKNPPVKSDLMEMVKVIISDYFRKA